MTVFLGSSSEAKDQLHDLAVHVENAGHTALRWDDPKAFTPGNFLLERLVELTQRVDAAMLIMTPDDLTWYRKDRVPKPRDNVLIEYGLFAGALGQKRTIPCVKGQPKLAIDLGGLNCLDLNKMPNQIEAQVKAWFDDLAKLKDQIWYRRQLNPGKAQLFQKVEKPGVLKQVTRLTIDHQGDCFCKYRRKIRPIQTPLLSVPHWIESDMDAAEIGLEVKSLTSGIRIEFLWVKDDPREKLVLLLFRPQVAVHKTVEYSLSWYWPKMFEKLSQRLPDSWIEEFKSATIIDKAELKFCLHRDLPKVKLKTDSVSKGQLKGLKTKLSSRHREYFVPLSAIAPGKRLEFELVP